MTNDETAHDGHEPPPLRIADPPQRVSGMRVLPGWALPGKPEGLDDVEEDAWRQTGFVCAEEWRLLEADLDIQARLSATGYQATARTMTMAAYASLWSRAFLLLSDSAALVRRGAYQSAIPLLRSAVEMVAAQHGLTGEMDEWRRWTHESYGRHEPTRSVEVGLGQYFSGESIASEPQLRLIYRAASDLSRPNFGPTALFTAEGASHERYPLVFADRAFHLGWTQLLLGWALRIGVAQLHEALHLAQHFPASAELRAEAVAHVRAAESSLDASGRCRVEEWDDPRARRRTILTDFRRKPSDAPTRILL